MPRDDHTPNAGTPDAGRAARTAADRSAARKPDAARTGADRGAARKPDAARMAADRGATRKPDAASTAADRSAARKPDAARSAADRSAARKPDAAKNRRVPVSLPAMETAAGSWMRGMRFSGFSLLMLVIIVLFIVILAPSLRTLIQQQHQISSLQSSVDKQKADVTDLKDDVARWNDPAYIEAQARDRLLYVYPGEYSYLVMNPDKGSGTTSTTTSGAAISKSIQNPKVDWVGAMMSSVLDAGLTKEPATKLVAPDISTGK